MIFSFVKVITRLVNLFSHAMWLICVVSDSHNASFTYECVNLDEYTVDILELSFLVSKVVVALLDFIII